MTTLNLKPEHKAICDYYSQLSNLTHTLNAHGEGAVAPIFANLLCHCAGQADRTLVEQFNIKRNGSALEWIVDQYRVKTDLRSGITNDPNNPDDPEYIVRLIKKIVTVSLETVEIVKKLPEQFE